MSSTTTDRTTASADAKALQLIDADVHCSINSIDDLMPYLPPVWQHYVRESGFKGPPNSWYPKVKPNASRTDAWPPGGRLPGSDLAFMQKHHLDHWKIDRAVMNPLYAADAMRNVDLSAALCAAFNDYMIENFYEQDERMLGSITVPWRNADLAVREVERVGGHERVAQIILMFCHNALYGQRPFHPIWEAAEKHNLVVGLHWGGTEPTRAAGADPSFYIEYHTNLAQAGMAHIVSFVCEGVFNKYPKLKLAVIEGGMAWLPALMWRLDKDWRGCRMEVPWLDRPPSEIIKQHVRLTTQPIEEPEDPRHLVQTIEHIGCDDMLMFATDYPHWDFDSPDRALPRQLPDDLKQRIRWRNAAAFYGVDQEAT